MTDPWPLHRLLSHAPTVQAQLARPPSIVRDASGRCAAHEWFALPLRSPTVLPDGASWPTAGFVAMAQDLLWPLGPEDLGPDHAGRTPLSTALQVQAVRPQMMPHVVLDRLIARTPKAWIDQADPSGMTPLQQVCETGTSARAVRQLITRGADPDQKGGGTLLMLAGRAHKMPPNSGGQSLLHTMIYALLNKGASPNAQDPITGKTVLHRCPALPLDRLLGWGFDPYVVDATGRTVLDALMDAGLGARLDAWGRLPLDWSRWGVEGLLARPRPVPDLNPPQAWSALAQRALERTTDRPPPKGAAPALRL